jgi:hypothetical protein
MLLAYYRRRTLVNAFEQGFAPTALSSVIFRWPNRQRRSTLANMRKLYAVIDGNGTQTQAVETLSHGEAAIAREFGISGSELVNHQTKRRNSKSFMAYRFVDGTFREIVPARAG